MASKAIGFLNFKFGADLSGFERAMKKAQKNLKKFGKNVTKAGQNLSRNLTLPILALGAASIKAFDEQAKAETKLLTALKGREDIQQRLITQAKELQKTTLFGDEATIESQALLASLGLTEEQILMLMPQIQNMAQALGTDLKSATSLVSKSVSTTTDALARYFNTGLKGVTGQQERAIVLTKSLTEKFEGQAEAAAKVGAGPLIQMQNQLGDIGEEIGQRLMPYVIKFVDWVKKLIDKFDNLSSSQIDNIVKWGLLLAAIGPVLIIIGKVSIGISSLIPLFTKLGTLIIANPYIALGVALIIIADQIYRWATATEELTGHQKTLKTINDQAASSILDQKIEVDLLTSAINDENTAMDDKIIALNELKKISPQYYNQFTTIEGNINAITAATERYTDALLLQAKVEATKDVLAETYKKGYEFLMGDGTTTAEAIKIWDEFIKTGKLMQDFGGKLGEMEVKFIDEETEKDFVALAQSYKDLIEALKVGEKELSKLTPLASIISEDYDNNDNKNKLNGVADNLEIVSLAVQDVTMEADIMQDTLDGLKMPDDLFNTDPISKFSGELGELGAQLEFFGFGPVAVLEEAFGSMAEKMGKNLAQGAESFEEYGNTVKGIMREVIGAMISAGVAAAVKNALESIPPFPGSVFLIPILAGAAAGLARTAFNSLIPEFAEGGLVTGPTTALIGEGVGTNAGNPEVVAPLDKLKQYMGGGNQNIIVEGVLKGNDIYLSNKNTSVNRLRTT
jgi:hypothetical protein